MSAWDMGGTHRDEVELYVLEPRNDRDDLLFRQVLDLVNSKRGIWRLLRRREPRVRRGGHGANVGGKTTHRLFKINQKNSSGM